MQDLRGGNTLIDVNLILEKLEIETDMEIADLGCGSTGYFVFSTATLVGKKGRVYAVDVMKKVLENIKNRKKQENLTNIETVWSNLEVFKATKIDSNKLDIALLINILYQSKKRMEILQEAVRMLKKGGKLAVVEWKNISCPFGPPASEKVNKKQLIIATQRIGLKLHEEFEPGNYHYGLIFIKI